MAWLKALATVLFIFVVPIFLIAGSVRIVINAPALYSYGFDRYNIAAYTGIERDDLLDVAARIRTYFNDESEYLIVPTTVRGIQVPSLYNEREILHMKDVKDLVRGVYRVQEAAGLYILAFAAFGLALYRRPFLVRLARYAGYGGGLTLGIVLLAGIGALVGFDRLFLAFHLVSFTNDLWQLDPRRDYLIAMFPEAFFFDATMLIALAASRAGACAGGHLDSPAALVAAPTTLTRTDSQMRADGKAWRPFDWSLAPVYNQLVRSAQEVEATKQSGR